MENEKDIIKLEERAKNITFGDFFRMQLDHLFFPEESKFFTLFLTAINHGIKKQIKAENKNFNQPVLIFHIVYSESTFVKNRAMIKDPIMKKKFMIAHELFIRNSHVDFYVIVSQPTKAPLILNCNFTGKREDFKFASDINPKAKGFFTVGDKQLKHILNDIELDTNLLLRPLFPIGSKELIHIATKMELSLKSEEIMVHMKKTDLLMISHKNPQHVSMFLYIPLSIK